MSARWLPCFCFLCFLFLPGVFLVFGCVVGGTHKSWISVAGVLRAMVIYVFGVAFWQVVVLLFFIYFFVLPWCFLFLSCFLGGKKKASGTVSGASFGLKAMVFRFLVALRFECTVASLVFLCIFFSCLGVSLFLVVFFWGARKKVDQCCWRVACHGVYVFVVAFWRAVVLSCFDYFFVLPWSFLFFELFSWGQTQRWISASGTVFGASFWLQAIVFCGFVF